MHSVRYALRMLHNSATIFYFRRKCPLLLSKSGFQSLSVNIPSYYTMNITYDFDSLNEYNVYYMLSLITRFMIVIIKLQMKKIW